MLMMLHDPFASVTTKIEATCAILLFLLLNRGREAELALVNLAANCIPASPSSWLCVYSFHSPCAVFQSLLTICDVGNHCSVKGTDSQVCMPFAGQPISLSFIGGSTTEGGGVPVHDRPPLSFSGKVSNWFINTFPNSSITLQNAGVGGVTSTYYGQCVDMFVSDENVDLVFVDFTLNDRASGVMGKSPQPDTPDRSVNNTISL